MEVEHIVWQDWNYTDKKVVGILELQIYHHGESDSDIVIMEGTFIAEGRGKFVNSYVTIDENTMGISGVSLRRVGEIID